MKKLLLLLVFIVPTFCKAQTVIANASKSNDVSRFIIVQSPIAVKATFRLDTYTGDVCQLVRDSTGKELWQLVKRLPTSHSDTRYADHSNYNLFVSTLVVRCTYLFNTNTGATWQWFHDPKTNEDFFGPMDDQ